MAGISLSFFTFCQHFSPLFCFTLSLFKAQDAIQLCKILFPFFNLQKRVFHYYHLNNPRIHSCLINLNLELGTRQFVIADTNLAQLMPYYSAHKVIKVYSWVTYCKITQGDISQIMGYWCCIYEQELY